jgi:hypothetical protein
MESSFNFLVDQTIRGKIYPALAKWQARPYTPQWRQFGEHWPFTTPLRVQEYCVQHQVNIHTIPFDADIPEKCYYPICVGFFDFGIDYVDLLPAIVKELLRQDKIKILFFYHEGDNPIKIKSRLDCLFANHGFQPTAYVFVSSNTRARDLSGFVYFTDFELWYFQRNIEQECVPAHLDARSKDFTVLSRIHKWWRAAAMTDLHRNGLLQSAYWSYCQRPDNLDITDCPIEIDSLSRLRWDISKFMSGTPYTCDTLDDSQKNDHSMLVAEHFADSYCNIVLESQFDVDQSDGAFLTEKTFKPIKHGQLFFIAGGPGSVQLLRDLGYKTFDKVLDHSYDLELDPTQRWLALLSSIKHAKQQGLSRLYTQCIDEILHNQELFSNTKTSRLNTLMEQINAQHR